MPQTIRDLYSGKYDDVYLLQHEVARVLRVHPASARRWNLPVARTNHRGGREYLVRDVCDWLDRVGRASGKMAA